MAIHIILADTDEDYLMRLERYIESKDDKTYHLTKCTTKETLEIALAEEAYDVLLFTSSIYDAAFNFKKTKATILLFDEDVPLANQFKRSINKYTKITSLLEYIDAQYEEAEKNKPIVYGIYSPAGGVGKTTIALAIAIANTYLGKKTFYINTESFDSTPLFFESKDKDDKNISISLSMKDTSIPEIDKFFVQADTQTGIMYFENVKQFNTHAFAQLQICNLIETIIDQEIASVIVIDLNTALDDFNKGIFEIADQLLVVAGGGNSNYKLNRFLAEHEMIETIKPKLKLIMNQAKSLDLEMDFKIAGQVDNIHTDESFSSPLALSEYIAQKNLIALV